MILSSVVYAVCILFAIIIIHDVNGQICTRRKMVIITKQVSYVYTYKETYQANCWYGSCQKTRIESRPAFKTITTREMRDMKECCDGYIREQVNTSLISCKPICVPICINSYCEQPNSCVCHEGFFVDPTNLSHCQPICSEGCSHGKCVAPGICECDSGYALNGTCQPTCSQPCENSLCTGPDICECLEGYRISEGNRCTPYCSKGCANGTCIQPEICQCDPGYTKIEEECVPECNECGNGACIAPNTCRCDSGYVFQNGTCQPACNNSCDNGKCVAPDTCECNAGYTLENSTCQPFCSKECGMGRCSEPNNCECYVGYKAIKDCDPYCCGPYCSIDCQHGTCTEDSTCECNVGYKRDDDDENCIPDCKYDCGNGTCIEPNICKCLSGYEVNKTRILSNESLCEPVCQNCEGACIAPNMCICYPPYVARDERADGEDCDCFSNCSDVSRQCHRTTCALIVESSTSSVVATNGTTHWNTLVMIDFALTEGVNNTTPISILNRNSTVVDITTGIFNATVEPITDNDTKSNLINETAEPKDKQQWSFPVWIYVVISMITIVTIITIVLIIKRRSLSKYFKGGGSYVVQDLPVRSGSFLSIDIKFSNIKKRDS